MRRFTPAWCATWAMAAGCNVWLATVAPAQPRVASLNLCTDQLALMLADRQDIVALTPLVQDCSSSVLCHSAQGMPVQEPTAENVLAARPDMVLAGRFTARVAVKAAREEGAKVLILPPVSNLAEIPDQIMQVAKAVGHPERGVRLVTAFQDRLAALALAPSQQDPIAAVYEANGFVARGASLPDDVLRHAGLRNLSTIANLAEGGRIPLETLLGWRPDLLVRDRSGQGQSLAQAMLDNPVLAQFFSGIHGVDLPASLWLCGLPQTLDAVAILQKARAALLHSAGGGP
ncbi:MAG: ABC transporter substrate-binding protein [Acetobacter cibinongensis]